MQDNKILVWLPSPMGDAILCTPALRAVQEKFKSSEITFLANKTVRNILSPCSFNDNWLDTDENLLAIAKKLKEYKFSHAILFKNSFASALAVKLAKIPIRIGYAREHRGLLLTDKLQPEKLPNGKFKPVSMVDYYLKIASKIGADIDNKNLELSIEPSDIENLKTELPQLSNPDGPVIIFVPGGAFGQSKCWPSDRFAETAQRLINEYNATIVISVAPNPIEKKIAKEICSSELLSTQAAKNKIINLADHSLSLGQLKALFSFADLVIANDTGPRHIAVALGQKIVTLFGPNNPDWTDTNYENEIQIVGNVTCSPCHNPKCTKDKHYCMGSISVDMVYNAAKELLENNRSQSKVFSRKGFIKISDSFTVDPDFKNSLSDMNLNSIDDIFSLDTAKNLNKKNLARFRSRLEFEIGPPHPTTLFLKRYDNPPISAQLKNWISGHSRKSLGFLEFETTENLSQSGINTPETVAYGEQWNLFFEKRSFIITKKIPDAEALERKLPDCFQDKTTAENIKQRKIFIVELAEFIRKFHETNYRHRDLYFAHIFHDDKGNFFLIDLARAFKPILQSRRFQIKDIAQLYYSAPGKYFSQADRLRFYLHYTNREKINLRDKIFIRKVLNKVQSMVKHDKKHGRNAPFEK